MKQIDITPFLKQFTVEESNENPLGRNIFMLHQATECILIDTGYQQDIEDIKEILNEYNITSVIISHFHPDHCYGLLAMEGDFTIYGNHRFQDTLSIFEKKNHPNFTRIKPIKNVTDITFHEHTLTCMPIEGHSESDLLILLDDTYLFIGDLLIFNNSGELSIPYVAYTVQDHIHALEKLLILGSDKIVLPSHGIPILEGCEKPVQHALAYLHFLQQNNKNIDDFYKHGSQKLKNDRWHLLNIQNMNSSS